MQKMISELHTVNLEPCYIKLKIPKDWRVISLKDIVKSHNSGIFKNQEFYGEGENIIGVSDLYNHTKIDGQTFRLVKLTKEEKKNHVLEEGDLIYGESSLVRTGIGKSLYVTKKGAGTIFAWHTRRFKVNSQSSPSFIYYMLDFEKIRGSIISRSTTTALTGVTTNDYFKTKMPFPKKEEQQKIASILSNIDSLLNQTQKEIEQTQKLKNGLMQRLLTKGIGYTKFKKVKSLFGKYEEIPEKWNLLKLSDLAKKVKDIVAGPFGSNLKVSDYKSNGVPIIRLQNIERNLFLPKNIKFISDEKAKELSYHSYKPNDLILAKLGAPIGKTCKIPEDMQSGIIVADVVRIRLSPKKSNSKFIEYILNSEICEKQLNRERIGTTRPRVNLNQIRNLKFPCPPLPEQQKIASILSNVNSKIEKHREYKSKLETLKKGLMQKLLTGQIRVKV